MERERTARSIERARSNAVFVRERCKTLAGFIKEAWPILHPETPYVHGWHIDFLCEHLEAITSGRLLAMGFQNRLLINEPPGVMKSLLTNVFWPAWEWGPANMPWLQYLATAYREDLCKRDNRKTRGLVASEWYQTLWPHVRLIREGESAIENDKTGWRESVPFKSLTGGRGHRVIIDDPHSVDTAESDVDRAAVTMRFRESVTSRLNDPKTSAIVVIMHRLHQGDLSGTILQERLGYTHIMLPMRFEMDNRCVTPLGQDPRTYEGELLFPERMSREVVERDEHAMTAHAVSSQFQQRPVSREGNMFKLHWFADKRVNAAPAKCKWWRHWDLAASTKKTSARTAGIKMGRAPDGNFYVGHCSVAQIEGDQVRNLIKATAQSDGLQVSISLPQDPGQAGKVQAKDYVRQLAGFVVSAERETGDKEIRAEPFASQCEAGNVFLVDDGTWDIDAYLQELCAFPAGHFKDRVDASSGAFARLIQRPALVISKEVLERAALRMPPTMRVPAPRYSGGYRP